MSSEDRRGYSPGAQIVRGERDSEVKKLIKEGSAQGTYYPFKHKHVVIDLDTAHLGIFRPTGKEEEKNGVTLVEQKPNDLATIEDAISQTLWIVPPVLLVTPQSYERRDVIAMQSALDTIGWWNQFPITDEDLAEKQAEVKEVMEKGGYDKARDPLRKTIRLNADRATEKDSLERINAKRSEVFAAMMHRAARLRVDKNTSIWYKNAVQIFPDLVNLRQKGRKKIRLALKAIRRVAARSSDAQFVRGVQTLIRDVPTIIPPIEAPTAPYAKSVARTYFLFTQHDKDDPFHDWVYRILGEEEFDSLSGQTSFQEWVHKYPHAPRHAIEALRPRVAAIAPDLDQPLQEGGRRMREKIDKHWAAILKQTA